MGVDDKDFAREALDGFFRRRAEAGKVYCAACLVERLGRRGAGAFPPAAVQADLRVPRAAAYEAERPVRGLQEAATLHRRPAARTLGRAPAKRRDVQRRAVACHDGRGRRALDRGRAAPTHLGGLAGVGGDRDPLGPADAGVLAILLARGRAKAPSKKVATVFPGAGADERLTGCSPCAGARSGRPSRRRTLTNRATRHPTSGRSCATP